jgi:sigma-B regulation protein RsbU (phosphoserine phosphatase)
MAEVRAYLRAYARMTPDAEEILGLINKDLITASDERLFVTMLVVGVDPGARSLVYSNAGHTSGHLIGAGGEVKMELASTGTALGLFPDSVFPASAAIPVEEGDILVLATDGITECEAPDGTFFDADGLLGAVRAHRHGSAREILSGTHGAARAFAGERGLADDITLVVCKAGKP